MNEILLNGILHLFAIVSAFNRQQKAVAHDLVDRYLKRNLGVAKGDVYLDLFDQFLDLYTDLHDADILRKNTRELCENLVQTLSRLEQYIVLLRVTELVETLSPSRELGILTAQIFSIPEEDREAIARLVFDPDRHDGLPRDFLIVSDRSEGPLSCRMLKVDHFQGAFVVLRVPEINTFLLSTSAEGITLDDNPIPPRNVQILPQGCHVRDIYRNVIYFAEIEKAFYDLQDRTSDMLFQGEAVDFRFPGSDKGLHQFSFAIPSGSLVGVMGGSGVGKSTLLSILNGTLPPDSGSITINGIDLYRETEKLEGVIGYVPQDDLLFGDLTVQQNLYYSARLCLDHLSDGEISNRVEKILFELNQHEVKDLKVGSPVDKIISGGQRKRLNIALELIREPSILFVDEPTSGLSSSDSENVMGLLKSQASKGKLVIVNIHQPSSNIFKMFDHLWILDEGGYPIFAGNPVEAVRYFRESVNLAEADQSGCPHCGNVNPEQIFNIIETKKLNETGQFTRERRYTPKHWHRLYLERESQKKVAVRQESYDAPARTLHKPTRWGQLKIFLERNVMAKISNRPYLAINLLEAPLLGLIVSGITRFSSYGEYRFSDNKYIAIFYFMSIIVAMFMGLSISAEEVVRDRAILKRENFLNLSWLSYWSSKGLYLAGISALQMLIYVLVSTAILQIHDMTMKTFLMLFSCSVFACLLGLNISSAFKTAVTIYILIPLLLIPQILLCGVVIKFDDLKSVRAGNNYVPFIGEIMASRWGLEALVVEQFRSNGYQKNFFAPDQAISRSEFVVENLIPEIQAKLDYLFLKTDLPGKDEVRKRYAGIVLNEVRSLEGRTGFLSGMKDDQFTVENLTRSTAGEITTYLQKVSELFARNKADAVEQKKATTGQLVKQYGEKGLAELKSRYQNNSIANLVRNRDELDALRILGGRLVQLSDPIYQRAESRWGRAVFTASGKRLLSIDLDTYLFNLLALWLMTAIMALSLHYRVFKRILDRSR